MHKAGRHVLINGAGGCVGSIAVQIAKADGAQVTGIDSGDKLDMIKALGADQVIDYAQQDVTKSRERYDVILDVASTLSLSRCRPILTDDGMYVYIGHDHFGQAHGRIFGSVPHFFGLVARGRIDRHLPRFDAPGTSNQEKLAVLAALLDSGKLSPVIASTFSLGDISVAMRAMQEGKAPGRIVMTP
jgi:NADPH:quinone reductase-like Zn-dependent oxidoreductase